jgi:hypothetical protein
MRSYRSGGTLLANRVFAAAYLTDCRLTVTPRDQKVIRHLIGLAPPAARPEALRLDDPEGECGTLSGSSAQWGVAYRRVCAGRMPTLPSAP